MELNDMSNLLDMMEKFKELDKSKTRNSNDNTNTINSKIESTTEDINCKNPAIKTLKAILPHMPDIQKKTWHIMLKTLELQELIEDYHKNEVDFNTINNHVLDISSKKNMLIAFKPLTNKSNQEAIDKIIQFMDLNETLNLMKSFQNS